MCTAINETIGRHLFGRTLDLEYSLSERAVITPRNFQLDFLHEPPQITHQAIIGIAHIANGKPLYYDAINESGLAVAALNFGESATYLPTRPNTHNIASFELILWVLGRCKNVREAANLLSCTTVTDDSFSASLPATPMHWFIADSSESIVVEPMADGLKILNDPYGVLTNEPRLDFHLTNIKNYMSLDAYPPHNSICPNVKITPYSRGMGAIGLPGDFSSASRFIRAVFLKSHTLPEENEEASVNRFFRITDNLCVPQGCVITDGEKAVRTVYTSCADTETSTYYFSTYEDRRIHRLQLSDTLADSDKLFSVPINNAQ